jgi:hypothetical protein
MSKLTDEQKMEIVFARLEAAAKIGARCPQRDQLPYSSTMVSRLARQPRPITHPLPLRGSATTPRRAREGTKFASNDSDSFACEGFQFRRGHLRLADQQRSLLRGAPSREQLCWAADDLAQLLFTQRRHVDWLPHLEQRLVVLQMTEKVRPHAHHYVQTRGGQRLGRAVRKTPGGDGQ